MTIWHTNMYCKVRPYLCTCFRKWCMVFAFIISRFLQSFYLLLYISNQNCCLLLGTKTFVCIRDNTSSTYINIGPSFLVQNTVYCNVTLKTLLHSGQRGWQNPSGHFNRLKSNWTFWKVLDIFWAKSSFKTFLKHENWKTSSSYLWTSKKCQNKRNSIKFGRKLGL